MYRCFPVKPAVLLAMVLVLMPFVAMAEGADALNGAKVFSAGKSTITVPYGRVEISAGKLVPLGSSGGGANFIFDGQARLVLDGLPKDESLNLFAEMGETGRDGSVTLELSGFYVKAGSACAVIAPPAGAETGVADAETALYGYYIQSWSDAFPAEMSEEEMAAMMGGGASAGPKVHDPKPDEFFFALFTKDGARFDFTRDDSGHVTISDYRESFTYYEHPYAVVEEGFDARFDFAKKTVSYTFDPAKKYLTANATLTGKALATMSDYTLYCYPWLELKYAEVDGKKVNFARGESGGQPTWAVTIPAAFKKNKSYDIYLEFSGAAPDSYDTVGYAGVYRFDDYIVYTADDKMDKTLEAEMPEGAAWSFVASPGASVPDVHPNAITASWEGNNRGVMLVATQFPKRELKSGSVTLDVYAPKDIIGSVEENPAVEQLGQMLDYFGKEFGVYSKMYPGGKITRQPLFIIPDEGGVAAFENAGLLFYLGSDNSLPLVAHEVSHIWWGHMVDGPVWFVEGMANYCPIAYLEEYAPESAMSYRRYIMGTAVSRAKPMSLDRRSDLGDDSARYQYSAGLWITLDRMAGKAEFHRALNALCKKYTDAEPVNADRIFGELGSELAKTKIDMPAFRKCFYDKTLAYNVSAAYATATAGPQNAFTITVTRDPALKGWMPLDMTVNLAGGKTVDLICDTAGPTTSLSQSFDAAIESVTLDPKSQLLVVTPERAQYIKFLGWLMPAWQKRGMGDTEGAIYCFEHALVYRRWARDLKDLADMYFKAGRTDDAWKLVNEILAAGEAGTKIGGRAVEPDALARTNWLAGKMTEAAGDAAGAKAYYEKALELAKQSGLYDLVKAAQEKLGIKPEEGEGAPPAGMGG